LAPGDELTWAAFTEAWYCAVRRIVLGERARDDRELTEMLARLRAAANWVYVLPARRTLRARYHARLNAYLARAEPGSLAAMIAAVNDPNAAPADQVTQWLFAFDGAGIGVFRALALLLTHAEAARPAAAEIEGWKAGHPDLPFLRASFVEALRLWPTTPAILREAAQDTSLGGASVQQGTGIIVYAPFFHRDNERLTNADRFDPNQWLYKDPAAAAPFVPFSAGPAACPGRHLASLIAGGWLAALLDGERLAVIAPADVRPDAPLPGTLDHFSIRFRVLR
jgi:cytochrome P450